ncbi:MAG: hypothetical protein Kow0092_23600 [Deferrisomatales bacterium]
MAENSDLLTPQEVAALLHLTEFTVWKLARRGELRSVRVRGRTRFRRAHVEAYLERLRIQAVGRPGKP